MRAALLIWGILLGLLLFLPMSHEQVVTTPPTPPFTASTLDQTFGSTRGGILERGAAGWQLVPPGTSGLPWVSNGPGADPAYQNLPVASTKALLTIPISITDPAFGAKCDGTTDDTTAIINAIASLPTSGGIILIPNATCVISSTIIIGNGTSSANSTRQGVILQGIAAPGATITRLGANPTVTGPRLLWNGSGSVSMISIAGPLQGWGLQNLILDCANVASCSGLSVVNGQFGDNRNLSVVNVSNVGIFSTANPLGGYSGAIIVDSWMNHWDNLYIEVNGTAGARALYLTGASDGSADTDFNTFSGLTIRMLGTVANTGITLQVADDNTFYNVVVIQGSGATAIQFDYSLEGTFPLGNAFYGLDVGSIGTLFANTSSPAPSAKPNMIMGLSEANGSIPVALPNLSTYGPHPVTYTPAPACGTATFTVNSAKHQLLGKTDFVQFDATITAIGTCTSPVTFTIPFTSASGGGLSGRDMAGSGAGILCAINGSGQTGASCVITSGTFSVNDHIVVSGMYETQ